MSKNALLEDIQLTQDTRGIALNRVGVKDITFPMQVMEKTGGAQPVTAQATFSVGLDPQLKGTHLSRFVELLTQWGRAKKVFCLDLQDFLAETRTRLKAPSAQIDIDFQYFIEKKAPVSDLSAPMAYDCRFMGRLTDETYRFALGVKVPMSTLCPCSKAISDFGAHNQRAMATVTVEIDPNTEHPVVWIEDLVSGVEETGSCPVFPLLKRVDEKWVTERQFTNAKFVEDVARDATLFLRGFPGILGFSIEVDALESIHSHNAWVAHTEKFDPKAFASC